MKSKRVMVSILLLAIVAFVLLFAYRQSIRGKISKFVSNQTFRKEKGEGPSRLLNPNDVVEIKIKNPTGAITLEKDEKGVWYVTEPARALADRKFVPYLPARLLHVEESELVEDNPPNLQKYSLDNPDVTVKFRLKGEKDWHALMFGSRAPTQSSYYTYNPETKKVFLAPADVKFDYNGSYDLYFDHKIFTHKPSESNHAVFEYSDVVYELTLDPKTNYWFMTKPVPQRLDNNAIRSFLNGYDDVLWSDMAKPEDLPKDTGLENPELKITFSKTGEWVETLIIGRSVIELARYIKLADAPNIYSFPDSEVPLIREKLDGLKIKNVIFFPKMYIKKIEFIAGEKSFTFTRGEKSFTFIQEAQKQPWAFAGDPAVRVDETALLTVIFKFWDAKSRGYTGASMPAGAAEYGLEKPHYTIKMEFFPKQFGPLNFYIGNKDPTGKFLYMYNSDDPNILKIDAIYDKILPKSPDSLLRR